MLDFSSPIVLLRDPELVKHLVVKEFDHFADHRVFIDETMDTLFGNSLISLTGQKWKDMRATLSPAFTGSKMRLMFELIVEVSEQMMGYIKKEAESKGMLELEMKQICSKFTNDVIALCAFGIKVDSFNDEDNEFHKTGKDMMNFAKPSRMWRFLGFRMLPKLMTFFKIPLMDEYIKTFFRRIVLNTMKVREEKNIHRPDMINLLMEVRKGTLEHKTTEEEVESVGFATVQESDVGKKAHKRNWTDDEVVAQCFLFFFAGFDTSSTVMSFAAYELTVNTDIQDKLYHEIREVNSELAGRKLTYEILQKMKYLDMVTSEVLRKWPPAPATDRYCVKDLDYEDESGLKIKFEKGVGLWIPVYGFHRDPKYYPNPDTFDPERFSDENKHLINIDTYLPFGAGPRNCIGSRFALMEVKALLYFLLLNFSFNVIQKTDIPLKLKTSLGGVATENGIWIGLKARE